MKIFFFGTEQKLPLASQPNFSDYEDDWDDPWFWLVHPGSLSSFLIEKQEQISKCIKKGGAILLISGSPLCSEEKAQRLEAEKNNRIHFLRSSCIDSPPNSVPSRVAVRILRFLKLIEDLNPYDAVPWSEVEASRWPENLLAIYLVVKALQTCPEDESAIRNAWDLMDTEWKRSVWVNAWNEYHQDLKMNASNWTDAGLPPLDGDLRMPVSSKVGVAMTTLRRAFPT
jgi:hypothetical protein